MRGDGLPSWFVAGVSLCQPKVEKKTGKAHVGPWPTDTIHSLQPHRFAYFLIVGGFFLVSLTIADKHVTGRCVGRLRNSALCSNRPRIHNRFSFSKPETFPHALLNSAARRRPRVVKLCIELCTRRSPTSAQTPPAPTLTIAACPRRRPRSSKLSPRRNFSDGPEDT